MNIKDYIKNGGSCKSKSGHWFVFQSIDSGDYPIKGFLTVNGKNFPYSWTEDGQPHNLPYTHQLDLVPVVPVVSYKMVKTEALKRYNTIEDFYHDVQTL